MPAVTCLQVFTAVKTRLAALGAWWAARDAAGAIFYGRRAPNGAVPPYVVVNIGETQPMELESDGCAAQFLSLEILGVAIGPTDAAAIDTELLKMDPSPSDPDASLVLGDGNKVSGMFPEGSRLQMIGELRDGGKDQFSVGRRWRLNVTSGPGL